MEVLKDAFVVEAGQDREVEVHFLVHDLVSLVVVVILKYNTWSKKVNSY